LDRIAEGYFSKASTDEELYQKFLQVLEDDGMRSSAPRIEAHYQYYHTAAEPSLKAEQDASCPAWVLFDGKQFCSPSLSDAKGTVNGDS